MSTPAKQTTRLRKVECPRCGCIVRMSRAAMAKSGLPSCGCGERMHCSDVNDQAALPDPCALEHHPDYADLMRRETNAAFRQFVGGGAGGRLQCGGCRRFIAKINETCGCGFTNDYQGRRNHGGYLGMSPDNRGEDLIPF